MKPRRYIPKTDAQKLAGMRHRHMRATKNDPQYRATVEGWAADRNFFADQLAELEAAAKVAPESEIKSLGVQPDFSSRKGE